MIKKLMILIVSDNPLPQIAQIAQIARYKRYALSSCSLHFSAVKYSLMSITLDYNAYRFSNRLTEEDPSLGADHPKLVDQEDAWKRQHAQAVLL
jgi:hypothetical protein